MLQWEMRSSAAVCTPGTHEGNGSQVWLIGRHLETSEAKGEPNSHIGTIGWWTLTLIERTMEKKRSWTGVRDKQNTTNKVTGRTESWTKRQQGCKTMRQWDVITGQDRRMVRMRQGHNKLAETQRTNQDRVGQEDIKTTMYKTTLAEQEDRMDKTSQRLTGHPMIKWDNREDRVGT